MMTEEILEQVDPDLELKISMFCTKNGLKTIGSKKYFLLFLIYLIGQGVYAQTFTAAGRPLYDYFGHYFRQEFNIAVSGLSGICDTTFGLEAAMLTIHHPRVSDLKISLESPDGASIWLTNRNGKDSGENYINTRFSQFGKDGIISSARAPFTGNFRPDGQLEFLNYGQNPNGIWKLYVEDLKAGDDGMLDSFSLIFSNKPAHAIIINHCDLTHIGLCKCASGKKNGELLPDLVIVPYFTQNQVAEYAPDDKFYPSQLRIAATIANIGYGPMEIKGTKEWVCGDKKVDSSIICPDGNRSRLRVKQRVYSKQNDSLTYKDSDAGTMYFENMAGHHHYHVDDWVEFRLVQILDGKRKVVAKGQKVSYCLFTTGMFYNSEKISKFNNKNYSENMPNYGLGNYPNCDFDKQGICVGGYDTYGMLYEGQYLNLPKGLKKGEYTLEIEIDPHHWYRESNRDNNVFRMKIMILKQEGL